MSRYAVYSMATGQIIAHGECPPHAIRAQASAPGEGVIELPLDADVTSLRVTAGRLEPLRAMPVTVDGLTIHGIPTDAILTIEGVKYHIPDGEARLSFTLPGRYPFLLRAPGYRDFAGTLIAP